MSPSRDQIRSNQATSVLFHYRQGGRPRNLGDEFRRRRARNIPHAQSACSAVTARIGSGETSRQLIEVVEQQRAPVGCHITQWRNELTSRIADRVGKPKRIDVAHPPGPKRSATQATLVAAVIHDGSTRRAATYQPTIHVDAFFVSFGYKSDVMGLVQAQCQPRDTESAATSRSIVSGDEVRPDPQQSIGIKCVDFPRKSDFAIMPSKFDVPHSPNAARRCKGISWKWTSGTREARGWIGANGCAAAAAACSSPPCRSARFDSSCVVRFR